MADSYPKSVGGGWYELSNGEKVQGEEDAEAAEAKLKPAPKKKAAKKKAAKPSGPTYEDVVAARRSMEAAQAQVHQADLSLRSAYAYHADFGERDRRTAEAREALNRARSNAAAATNHFEELRRKRSAK